jgi:hypothetical protein
MSHTVIPINQSRRFCFLNDADVRPQVQSAGSDAANVLRQAEDAVAIGAAQVSKDHQPRHLLGIRYGQAERCERASDERFEIG